MSGEAAKTSHDVAVKTRVLAAVFAALALGMGAEVSLAETATHEPDTWLVYLGHRISASQFGTIKVYITGTPHAGTAKAHAIKQLEAMGAPAPDQTVANQHVIVKPGGTARKWLVTLGQGSSRIIVGVVNYPDAATADARASKQLEHMGAARTEPNDQHSAGPHSHLETAPPLARSLALSGAAIESPYGIAADDSRDGLPDQRQNRARSARRDRVDRANRDRRSAVTGAMVQPLGRNSDHAARTGYKRQRADSC